MSINWWMQQRNVANPYNSILTWQEEEMKRDFPRGPGKTGLPKQGAPAPSLVGELDPTRRN